MERTTATEACTHALPHTKGPLDASWSEDRWSKGEIEVATLRTAHADFSGLPITKNERMIDILDRSRSAILAGDFPRTERILEGGPIPAVMVERDDSGEFFVADGQGRVLSALWHGVAVIDAFVFSRPGVRTLPDRSS